MEMYQVKMSTNEFSEYLHRTVGRTTLTLILQRYSQEELSLLVEKMEKDLERVREKENVYPKDWEQFIDAIKNLNLDLDRESQS